MIGLMIVPASESFDHIYRDASGIRWNRDFHALVAYEPDRWTHDGLFEQILFAVRNEYGVELFIDAETTMDSLSDQKFNQLKSISDDFPRKYQALKYPDCPL